MTHRDRGGGPSEGKIAVTRHPKLARAALAEYPNIKGRMVYRPRRTE